MLRVIIERPKLPVLQARIVGLILSLVLGWLFASELHDVWAAFWLTTDESSTTVVQASREYPSRRRDPDVVYYDYVVDGKGYEGKDYIDRYAPTPVVVYYSTSHPWQSSLQPGSHLPVHLFVVLLVLYFGVRAVSSVINPLGRIALFQAIPVDARKADER